MTQISTELRELVLAEFRDQSAAGTEVAGRPGGDAVIRAAWVEDLVRTVYCEVAHRVSYPNIAVDAVQSVMTAAADAHTTARDAVLAPRV